MNRSDVKPMSATNDTVEPAVTGTQSVFRALSILHAFSSRQPALTGPEIAAKFGYSVPPAYRLLRALEAEQFLVFDRVTRKYSPGPEIIRLSGVMLHRDGVVAQTQSSQLMASVIAYLFKAHHGTYGSPRIIADLQEMGWCVSPNTVARLMAEQDLIARRTRRRRSLTRSDRSARKVGTVMGVLLD